MTADDHRAAAQDQLYQARRGGGTSMNLVRLLRGILHALLALGGDDR